MWDIKNVGSFTRAGIQNLYYLNHVGYKDDNTNIFHLHVSLYYLNHVGYKDTNRLVEHHLFFVVLSEPCGI